MWGCQLLPVEGAVGCVGEFEGVGAGAGSASEDGVPLVSGRHVAGSRSPVGRLILVDPDPKLAVVGRVVAYCRVCSATRRTTWNARRAGWWRGRPGRGLAVGQVVSEVGSGMNGHRRKLAKLLSDPTVTVIVVEHRDRLTRFGFEHLQASMAACGRSIVVLEPEETTSDLVRDVTEVLTWLCARVYGQRSAAGRAAKAVAVATGTEPR